MKPDVVRDLVDDLIANRQFEEVISCIEQAILNGQVQSWMHQVLALAMQAVGRPQSQIERVLLSSQDLITNDPQSMMVLAAYLVRFDRHDRAIELYRQAANLDPTRPEPYILALELAEKHKNYPAVAWSAPEVLAYSWGKGREQLHDLAEKSAAAAIAEFLKNGNLPQALELQTAMQNARQLDLTIRVEWNGQGDLDLAVHEPGGNVCSVIQPMTSSGGVFVHDGFGPNQENCYEEYLCPQGLSGEYRLVIKHVSGTIVGKRARVTIRRGQGTASEELVTETILLGPADQVIRFSLANGRRQVANAAQQLLNGAIDKPKASSPTYLAQLGNGGGAGQATAGNRAVGYTPVITTLDEGIRLGAMATVSGDRRYVRITAQPVFSTITDVFTFSPTR